MCSPKPEMILQSLFDCGRVISMISKSFGGKMEVQIHQEFFKSLKKCFRSKWHPQEIWYKLKCWAWHRYSTVHPRYLDHTWVDRVELLPHTMFEILSDFVENECSPGHIEWYYGHKVKVNGEERYVRDEMQEIYDWWHTTLHKEYPKKEEQLWEEAKDFKPNREFHPSENELFAEWRMEWDNPEAEETYNRLMNELQELEEQADRETTDYMHRLVNVRQSLWT